MAANNALIVTDINFDTIKSNLQSYLSSQNEFKDYDFEASGMQEIINLLAYNTYYNSIYTNFVANEMFLDSALIRNNVVARAKMLGYTPQSAKGARASLRTTITPSGSPTTVTVPANTQFTTAVDGVTYTFSTISNIAFTPDANSNYINTLTIREGDPVQESYTVSSTAPVRYLLNNENCDTDSLVVTIQTSSSNTSIDKYTVADGLTTLNGNSTVYFLQENNDGAFEVQFGDGVLGKRLADGNIVKLNYNVCNGPVTNGVRTFTGPATLGGSNYTFTVSSAASGGSNPQSIDSIKFSAPKNYENQNRAVTVNDYKSILLAKTNDLETISVWGGEQNNPPIYGKVYICAKPFGGNILTDLRKSELVSLLDDYNSVTLEPVFVDATFLYIVPTVTLTYNSNRTSKSPERLITQSDGVISTFQSTELSSFSQTFYESRLMEKLTKIDDSVISVSINSEMQKRFIPVTGNVLTSYTLQFNNPIFNPHPGHKYAISSSAFTHNGFTVYFDDDGSGNLRIYRIEEGKRVYVNTTAGSVNYETGTINIFSIKISDYVGDAIKVQAEPAEEDISTIRNQILLIADAFVSVKDVKNNSVVASTTSTVSTTQATSPSDLGLAQSSYVY